MNVSKVFAPICNRHPRFTAAPGQKRAAGCPVCKALLEVVTEKRL